jgi:HPr kinase/phosphorylase
VAAGNVMAAEPRPTIHASVVLCGARAVLIRGPAGAGKSRLAAALINAASIGLVRFARLVADDRVYLEAAHGRLLARPADALAGLLEVRSLGITRAPFEPVAVIGLVVDLAATDAHRMPTPADAETTVLGVTLRRLAIPADCDPLLSVIVALRSSECRH